MGCQYHERIDGTITFIIDWQCHELLSDDVMHPEPDQGIKTGNYPESEKNSAQNFTSDNFFFKYNKKYL